MTAATLATPAATVAAESPAPLVVQTKFESWEDEWRTDPTLTARTVTAAIAGHDLEQAVLWSAYGAVKNLHEANLVVRGPANEKGRWVRVAQLLPTGRLNTFFVGRISGEPRVVHNDNTRPSGVQQWVAYGPLQILRKIEVTQSVWHRQEALRTLDWMPQFNDFDSRGLIVGNRTEETQSDTYHFGGTETWNYREILEYLLANFAEQNLIVGDIRTGPIDGPAWTVGGQAELLENLTAPIDFGNGSLSLAAMLDRLIPRRLGVDYSIEYVEGDDDTSEGFEIRVFALTAEDVRFGDAELPKNPRTFNMPAGNDVAEVSITSENSLDHFYNKIRVLGDRLLVCFSLQKDSSLPTNSQLDKKWTHELQTAYDDGTGDVDDDASLHDKARQSDRFRGVYQAFGAVDTFDWLGGDARPALDNEGNAPGLLVSEGWQNQVRKTETWLPLREGFDYSFQDPVDENPDDVTPDFLPPLALVLDPDTGRYLPVDKASIHVSALQHDWGLFLEASPNHKLGLNSFLGESDSAPKYDWETLILTIAARGDARLALEWSPPDGAKTYDGVKQIVEPDAQLWWLAANTVVGVNESNGAVITSGPAGRELRNDNMRLAMVMAGAIASYWESRGRASLKINRIEPWRGVLGAILNYTEVDGVHLPVHGAITHIEWDVEKQTTVVKTGHARK